MKAHLNVLERMLLAVTDCLADESPLPVGQQRPLCARWPLLPDWNDWLLLCKADLSQTGASSEPAADAKDVPLRKADLALSRASTNPAEDAKDPPEPSVRQRRLSEGVGPPRSFHWASPPRNAHRAGWLLLPETPRD
jgi:hypothetical protein